MERIGVLLNSAQLHRFLNGQRSFEKVRLYMRAADELGVGLVLFDINGVNKARRQIWGHIPVEGSRRLKTAYVPIPKVVHKRALYGDNKKDKSVVSWLEKQGVLIYNGFCQLSKLRSYQILVEDASVREHLPVTFLLTRQDYSLFRDLLLACDEIFIKPRYGSAGRGIARVRRIDDKCRYETAKYRVTTTLRDAWKLAIRGRTRDYILQQGIPLALYRGKRYDLRVPVQRGEGGQWVVPGMVAKRAGKTPFLTNLARGGSAYTGLGVLSESIPNVPGKELYDRIETLALAVANAIGRRYPSVADLGLDIGLDRVGKPWLIEVNRRDQRYSFLEAGASSAFYQLYKNPIAYGKYLIDADEQTIGEEPSEGVCVLRQDEVDTKAALSGGGLD